MIALETKIVDETKKVADAAEKAAFHNFSHAGASISKDAKGSIKTSDQPSEPGTPPHTRAKGGKNIRGAIRFAADKRGAVIGPLFSVVGESMAAHELGEAIKGEEFPLRETMGPALERAAPRLGGDWEGSIGE
jgi:hypothetical protein